MVLRWSSEGNSVGRPLARSMIFAGIIGTVVLIGRELAHCDLFFDELTITPTGLRKAAGLGRDEGGRKVVMVLVSLAFYSKKSGLLVAKSVIFYTFIEISKYKQKCS